MRFIIRRAGFFVLTLWAALSLNFFLPRIMPGNPINNIISKLHNVTPAEELAIEHSLGINNKASIWQQYVTYLGHTAQGNLGLSYANGGEPVSQLIRTALPYTLGLIGITTILAFVIGTAIGAIAAWRRGSRLDSALPPLFVFTTAIPFFWVGMMLILIFSTVLGVLPSYGAFPLGVTPTFSLGFIGQLLQYAILPALTLLITSIGGWVLTMRNTMVTTLTEDYVRMARAKGLSSLRIMVGYAARNAILPNLTGFAMSLGFVVSGAILVEYVFNYPGVGNMLLSAVNNVDYPLMQGLFLIITVCVLIAILLSDIATAILDPTDQDGGVAMAIPVTTTGLPEPTIGISAPGRRSALRRVTKAIRTNRKATIGVVLMAIFVFVALFPGLFAHQDPNAITTHVFAHPSAAHWLGTDNVGRDVYAQVIDGTRNVLVLALAVGLLTTVIAMLIGVAAAYLGGLWDSVLNFVTDVLLVIPIFPLLIIIAAYLPNAGNYVLILVLTFTGWSYTARQLRSQAQSLRNRDFLLAARVRGERPLYIIVVEILPTMTSLLLASFLNNALYAVLAGSGLQFIGLGNSNNVSWGTTLYWAQQNNALGSGLYAWVIVPGACIALLGAAFAFINYAFDEIGNPALRPLTAAKIRKAAEASTKRRLASHGARAR